MAVSSTAMTSRGSSCADLIRASIHLLQAHLPTEPTAALQCPPFPFIDRALMNARAKPVLKGQHLLTIEALSPDEIDNLLNLADGYVELSRQIEKKQATLRGRTQINLFFEPSTRTQSSFELAGKRLGADVMNMSVASSSVKKGETLIDTAMTLNAMRPDILIIRHQSAGAAARLPPKGGRSGVNAGEG